MLTQVYSIKKLFTFIYSQCLLNSNMDSKSTHLHLPTTIQHSQNGEEFVNEYLRISNKSILGPSNSSSISCNGGGFSPNSNSSHNAKSSGLNHQMSSSHMFDQNQNQQQHHHHQNNHHHLQHHQSHHQNATNPGNPSYANSHVHNQSLISTGHQHHQHQQQHNHHQQSHHSNHHSNHHNHSSLIGSSNHQPDPELIELFEYTSQFNMDDTINSTHLNNQHQLHNHHNLQQQLQQPQNQSSSSSSESCSSAQSTSTSPVDQLNKSKLDLTIEGHTIKQPKWWPETMFNHESMAPLLNSATSGAINPNSNANTNATGSISNAMQQRYNNAQDDECDSSLFINQHHLQMPASTSLNSSTSNFASIIELKDLLFNSNEGEDESNSNSSNSSSHSSASLALSASNFNVDNFISYSTFSTNLAVEHDSNTVNNTENSMVNININNNNNNHTMMNTTNSNVQIGVDLSVNVIQLAEVKEVAEKEKTTNPPPPPPPPITLPSSSAPSNAKLSKSISSFVLLPSLSQNKTARKRIYTHQNRVNSLLLSHGKQVMLKTDANNTTHKVICAISQKPKK